MNCRVFDCDMPVAGLIYDELVPGPTTAKTELCESHAGTEMRHRLETHQAFAFLPFAVLAGRAAA